MHIHHIEAEKSILNHFIAEIRDVEIQKDRMRFRRNIERIGEILSYELSKILVYEDKTVKTPLGEKSVAIVNDSVVVCSVLRAGLPLHQGILNYFDNADNSFISAYRHHLNDTDFEIVVEYMASPSLENKILLLADPMLATGKSLAAVYEAIKPLGTPKEIHLISVIASTEGIDYVDSQFPTDTHLWIAAIDNKLSNKGYIVPGLGDAGDLSFGNKLQH